MWLGLTVPVPTASMTERFRRSGAGDVFDVVLLALEVVFIVFLLIVGGMK